MIQFTQVNCGCFYLLLNLHEGDNVCPHQCVMISTFPFLTRCRYEGPKPDNPNFRFFDTRKWDFTSRLIPFFRIPDFLLAEIQILLSLLNPVVQKWTTQIYKFLLVEDRKFQNLGFRALQNFRISTSRNSEFQVLALT